MFRVGFGYDVHRLIEGRRLILGGVDIPYSQGLLGNSDADVLTHAVIDAILGAVAKGDIGMHFPDSDPEYKDADSLLLLKRIAGLARRDGFRVNNLDTTIVAEGPRLSKFMGRMRERLAYALETGPGAVNIKTTTTEGLGFCGRREGIAAYAIVSLIREK